MFLGVAAIRRRHVVLWLIHKTAIYGFWASYPEFDVAEAVDAGFEPRTDDG
jgi:hypothetical protein